MKNTIMTLITLLLILPTAFAAKGESPDGETEIKQSEPKLTRLSLEGKLSRIEKKGKNGKTYTFYYLEMEDGKKVRLTKSSIPKPKKGKNGKAAKKLDLDEFAGVMVTLKGQGFTRELKNKKKQTYLKVIESIKKS